MLSIFRVCVEASGRSGKGAALHTVRAQVVTFIILGVDCVLLQAKIAYSTRKTVQNSSVSNLAAPRVDARPELGRRPAVRSGERSGEGAALHAVRAQVMILTILGLGCVLWRCYVEAKIVYSTQDNAKE